MILTLIVTCRQCGGPLNGDSDDNHIMVGPCRVCLNQAEEIASANILQRVSIYLGKGGDKLWEVTLPKQGF